jgi:hypothetical protein
MRGDLTNNEKKIEKAKRTYERYIVPLKNKIPFFNYRAEMDSTSPRQEKISILIEKDIEKVRKVVYNELREISVWLKTEIPQQYREYIKPEDFKILREENIFGVIDEGLELEFNNLVEGVKVDIKSLKSRIKTPVFFDEANSRIMEIVGGEELKDLERVEAWVREEIVKNQVTVMKIGKEKLTSIFTDLVGQGQIYNIIKDSTVVSIEEKAPGVEDGGVIKNISTKHKRDIVSVVYNYLKNYRTYFGAVEVDKDADISKFMSMLEYIDGKIPLNLKTKLFVKARKLGRLGAGGVYYPNEDIVAVGVTTQESLIHELVHAVDIGQQNTPGFKDKERKALVKYFSEKINQEELKQKVGTTGKYGVSYYLDDKEIMARLGEIYMLLEEEEGRIKLGFKNKEGLDMRILNSVDKYKGEKNEYFNFDKFTKEDKRVLREYFKKNIFPSKTGSIEKIQDELSKKTVFNFNTTNTKLKKLEEKREIFKEPKEEELEQKNDNSTDIVREFIRKTKIEDLREWLYRLRENKNEDFEYLMDYLGENLYEVLGDPTDSSHIGLGLSKKTQKNLMLLSIVVNRLEDKELSKKLSLSPLYKAGGKATKKKFEEELFIGFDKLSRDVKNSYFITATIKRLKSLSSYYYGSTYTTTTYEKYKKEHNEGITRSLEESNYQLELRKWESCLNYIEDIGGDIERPNDSEYINIRTYEENYKVYKRGKPILLTQGKRSLEKRVNSKDIEEFYPEYISKKSISIEENSNVYQVYNSLRVNTERTRLKIDLITKEQLPMELYGALIKENNGFENIKKEDFYLISEEFAEKHSSHFSKREEYTDGSNHKLFLEEARKLANKKIEKTQTKKSSFFKIK